MTHRRETNLSIPDGRWLDRLVDDELDENDRRRLLARLDQQSDGWRKCAMAFLEAQAWRRALSGLATDVNSSPCAVAETSKAVAIGSGEGEKARNASSRQSHLPWYVMAAGLLFAFLLGAGAQHVLWRHPSGMVSPLVEAQSGGDRMSTDDSMTTLDGTVAQVGGLGTGGAMSSRQVEEQVEAEIVGVSTAPAQLLEALRRSGHRIHRQRGIVPFRFEDGRQGLVPVEDVYVVPANLTTY